MNTKDKGFHTQLVHAGAAKDPSGSVVTPIYQTSTFAFENTQVGADRFAGKADGFIYTRIGNPTIRALEECVAELEEGVGGVATSSGMGAVTTACLALLARDEHVISTASVYGPSRTLMVLRRHIGPRGGAGGLSGEHASRLHRDAVESDDADHGYRRRGPDGA